MNIEILVTVTQPPGGQVCADGQGEQPFSGWLQLLKILADLLGADPADPADPATTTVATPPAATTVATSPAG